MINTIILGHALNILPQLPAESVNCVTTSPPYWGLRDYCIEPVIWDGDKSCEHDFDGIQRYNPTRGKRDGKGIYKDPKWEAKGSLKKEVDSNFCKICNAWRGSLGLEPTFELYIKHLCDIFDEVKRVLRKDGTVFVNLGDSYAGSGKAGSNPEYQNRHTEFGKPSIHPERFGMPTINIGVPDKSLCLIPQRFAIEMVNRGWILRNTIIWHKPNCMPSSAKDRFTVDFEYIYFFVKSKKYWFEQQFDDFLSNDYDRNRMAKARTEYGGKWAQDSGGSIKTQRAFVDGYAQGRNKRAVWTIPTKPFPEAHFAVYPETLIEPMIKAGCPEFICKECGKARVKILKPIGYIENADGLSEKINNKPYSMQERKGYISIRDLPTLYEIKTYLNKWKKIRDITVEEIEDRLESQAPHHWFSGESYPTKEGWLEIKELLGFDEIYDKQMIEVKYKPAEKLTGKYKDILTNCGCNVGFESGIVLDPFMGAGTSALAALEQRKRFIGIEIKQEYIDMSYKRIAKVQQEIF